MEPDITARELLAHNLRRLMDQSDRYGSTLAVEKRTEELGLKVGKSTVARLRNAETPVNLDYVEVLAKVFGVATWRMLAPAVSTSQAQALAEEFDRRVPAALRESTYAQVLGQIMFAEEAARGFALARAPTSPLPADQQKRREEPR